MTKINAQIPSDVQIYNIVKGYNIKFLVGNDEQKKQNFKNVLENKLKEVTILPYGSKSTYVNTEVPGVCFTEMDGSSTIEMYGFHKAPKSEQDFTVREFSHELWHSIINITNFIGRRNLIKFGKNNDGEPVRYDSAAGAIIKMNLQTGEAKEIGTMYVETLTDILTSGSLIANDLSYRKNGNTLDTVFHQKYDKWDCSGSGYSIFTSLTRLLISAFSNNGFVKYDDITSTGGSIFDIHTKLSCGQEVRLNTFLFNFAYDPIAIEEEFDSYLGAGSYERITTLMDEIFTEYNTTRNYTSKMKSVIKDYMMVISDFLNAKMAYMSNMGFINENEVRAIVNNYNRIWNSLQTEYKAFFTAEDIADIYNRAYQFYAKPTGSGRSVK